MADCKPRLLLEKKHLNIVQCKHCDRIGLYYKNLLAGFNVEEFFTFSSYVFKLNFEENAVPFANGARQIVVNTCHQDIQFTFGREEFEELVDVLNQARILIEAGYHASRIH